MLCPCGSERAFNLCCQPYILGSIKPASPEQLMRSRYSAYATQHAKHIFNTYAKTTRASQSLDEISQWAAQTKWLKLIIHSSSDFQRQISNGKLAQVEFSAFYQHQGKIWQMRECSNFIYEHECWCYLDGDVSESDALVKPKRNEPCFCQSKKKFKQCCAKNV